MLGYIKLGQDYVLTFNQNDETYRLNLVAKTIKELNRNTLGYLLLVIKHIEKKYLDWEYSFEANFITFIAVPSFNVYSYGDFNFNFISVGRNSLSPEEFLDIFYEFCLVEVKVLKDKQEQELKEMLNGT
jgi:hypothetical protein